MNKNEAVFSIPEFNVFENEALKQLNTLNKRILDTFKFQMIYSTKVSEKQEKETAKAVKTYRNKYWKEAMKKAKNDINKAYQYYTASLKELF